MTRSDDDRTTGAHATPHDANVKDNNLSKNSAAVVSTVGTVAPKVAATLNARYTAAKNTTEKHNLSSHTHNAPIPAKTHAQRASVECDGDLLDLLSRRLESTTQIFQHERAT
jgi:hypothetical protein